MLLLLLSFFYYSNWFSLRLIRLRRKVRSHPRAKTSAARYAGLTTALLDAYEAACQSADERLPRAHHLRLALFDRYVTFVLKELKDKEKASGILHSALFPDDPYRPVPDPLLSGGLVVKMMAQLESLDEKIPKVSSKCQMFLGAL
jgi:hypothetical protein